MNERINKIAKNLKGEVEVDANMVLMSEYRTYNIADTDYGYMFGKAYELSAKALYLDSEEEDIDVYSSNSEDLGDYKIIRKLRNIYANIMTGILTRHGSYTLGLKIDKAMAELYRLEDEMAKLDFKYQADFLENAEKRAEDVG
jgi:hypothetical protein